MGGGEVTCVVEEASFQEEVDQGVERVPDEEEAVAARGRRREGLERGAVGHGQDEDGRGERDEGGLVEQVWREASVGGCRIASHCDWCGVDGRDCWSWSFDGVGAVLSTCETR